MRFPAKNPKPNALKVALRQFVFGLILLLFFAFALIPWVGSMNSVREIMASTKYQGIDASALFYTDIELDF